MSIEGNLIISILKQTKERPVSMEMLKKDAKISSEIAGKLLEKMQNDKLLNLQGNIINLDSLQRLELAVYAVRLGVDIENISNFLQWQEFENIAAVAFEQNGYSVQRNLRFKHAGRRWEIDIVGCKKPLAICVDCKHWHHGLYPSALKRIVDEQVERTRALAEFLPNHHGKIECASWDYVKLVPVILSLVVGRFKFYDNVPVVSVLQLQDFLNQLPAYAESLRHFIRP